MYHKGFLLQIRFGVYLKRRFSCVRYRAEQLAEMKRLTEGGSRADQPEISDIFTVGEGGELDMAESSETGQQAAKILILFSKLYTRVHIQYVC